MAGKTGGKRGGGCRRWLTAGAGCAEDGKRKLTGDHGEVRGLRGCGAGDCEDGGEERVVEPVSRGASYLMEELSRDPRMKIHISMNTPLVEMLLFSVRKGVE